MASHNSAAPAAQACEPAPGRAGDATGPWQPDSTTAGPVVRAVAGIAGRPTASSLSPELRRALAGAARRPRLLVACDYDGTLAPIGPGPRCVLPLPEAVTALRALALLPDTTAAVISGRALRELAVLSRLPSEVHLIGSHGSEFDIGFVHALDDQARALHARLVSTLQEIADPAQGVLLEVKPASVAVHVRQADRPVARQVLAQAVGAVPVGRGADHRGQRRRRARGGAYRQGRGAGCYPAPDRRVRSRLRG